MNFLKTGSASQACFPHCLPKTQRHRVKVTELSIQMLFTQPLHLKKTTQKTPPKNQKPHRNPQPKLSKQNQSQQQQQQN